MSLVLEIGCAVNMLCVYFLCMCVCVCVCTDQTVPCQMSTLTAKDKVARYSACGEEHTLILTKVPLPLHPTDHNPSVVNYNAHI